MKSAETKRNSTKTKFLYATAIVSVIGAVSSGDASFNRALIYDIATAAQAAYYLLNQVAEEMEAEA